MTNILISKIYYYFIHNRFKHPLQINRCVQNFSREELSLKQNVHSEITNLMRKFGIFYEFRLFCLPTERFPCNFIVMAEVMKAYLENILHTAF